MNWVAGIAVALVFVAGLYFCVGNYFYNFALNTKRKRDRTFANADDPSKQMDEKTRLRRQLDADFKRETHRESRRIVSGDGLSLHAFVYPNPKAGHKWAVVVHGYVSHADEMVYFVRHFFKQGFQVLTPDLRGHGESEGSYVGMGWHDRKDLLQWIDTIIQTDSEAQIVLYGLSMGAATVMMTLGEPLPANVRVAVEDCGYTSVQDEFAYLLRRMFKLPAFLILPAADLVIRMRAGYSLYHASSLKQLAKAQTPLLFIHGAEDTFVPFYMLEQLYPAAPVEKEKLIIEGAGHFKSALDAPERYWSMVWAFCEKFVQ